MIVLPHYVTDLSAKSPKPNVSRDVNPLNLGDPIFNANTSITLGTKNLSSTPFRITVSHFSDKGFLKDVGNVTWNQTFKSTYLSDKLLEGKGNGTFATPDRQSIAWISSDMGRLVDGHWVFDGIILFNNTQSKPLSFLNDRIGLYKSVAGNETDYIWLLK
jgi:hypothetical protein